MAVGKKGERDEIAARTGYTGFCFLAILVGLFGFDLVRDNVGDWMHKGPENLVKNFLADCLWNPKKHPRNLTLPPEERSPLNGPFIPQASFGAQMSRFVWPRTLSAGRLPADPETKPLGFWKAEEHMKAGNFVFEAAFHGLIDEEGFAIATLAAKLMQTVYVIGAKCGWTAGLREVFEKLSYALAVRSEEYFGPKLRQLQHEICFHPLDDLMRHGSPDALWCWLMERYIKVLGSLTKNGKQIETTMTIKVVLGLVSAFLSDRREDQKLLKAGKLPGDADWAIARECFGGGLLIVGSQKIAIRMENLLAVRKSTTGSEDAGILHSITTRGVGVGSLHQNWRPRNWKQLGVESRIGVEAILLSAGAGLSERWAYVPAKSVQVRGANFAKGDLVVVGSVGGDENEEEFGQIKLVYVVEDDQEQRRVFVELSFFGVLRHEGELVGGEGHGLRMLGKLAPLSGGCVRLATSLLRHFIYFLEKGKTLATATYGHVIEVQLYGFDFKAADVYIPVFVEVRRDLAMLPSMRARPYDSGFLWFRVGLTLAGAPVNCINYLLHTTRAFCV